MREKTQEPAPEELPTEAVHGATRDLDKLSVEEVLDQIHAEDAEALAAVGRVLPQVAQAVDALVCAVGGGGRWFNVGAGTSGRMGVLDAAEIPPTFGMPAQCVQGLIAGGERALREAVEGAEDNAEAAAWELRERGLGMGDAVVALSASGRTPFALGAVQAAHEAHARSICITCDPGSPLAEAAEIPIVPEVGPEVIAGSTRMKGGLAQKMVLHLLSTTVMVQLGRVEGNLMTNLTAVSQKLRSRAQRIVMTLADVDEERARALLEESQGNVDAALKAARGQA
ncbi:MAG: N-acetylmuramic acid 6-phosphate etherase [Proteobacteria bacterium]|nr:N-acetylmuramic acid 6-phosphate etherase [Pseudomonadota bacterium]